MAKYNNEETRDPNEPGALPEESPYYDNRAEKEEKEKVPVEYLGFITRQKETRRERTIFWVILLIVIIGLGPGTKAKIYCPRSGEWRAHLTFAWGFLEYSGMPHETEWTGWYMSNSPEPHDMRWVPFGKKYPALFGFLAVPLGKGAVWEMPENLIERMNALDGEMRAGRVMDIPRVLESVNYNREWNGIILPLTLGTVDDAVAWWNRHKDELLEWSEEEHGTPIPESYLYEAERYIEEKSDPDGNDIPLY